jgi:Dolichyl-phosphate-mannose-protein mannosyltransferase
MELRKSRVAAGALLVGGIIVAWTVSDRLAALGAVPEKPGPYYLIFIGCFGLCVLAGLLLRSGEPFDGASDVRGLRTATPAASALRKTAAAIAIALFSWTWVLQGGEKVPLWILIVWVAAMAATVFAFPGADANRSRRMPGLASISWILLVLAIAALARLIGLDAVPPIFSGDESTTTMDGTNLFQQPSDPFAPGSMAAIRLGMLPAGVGAVLSRSPIAGPRFLYGIAGTLSVAAAAAVAGLLAGHWAALSAAALLALAPHHVHFSRLASHVVLDSLFVTCSALFLLVAKRERSPRAAALAGVFAGLALYGYVGGRLMAVVILLSVPMLFLIPNTTVRMRAALAAALLAGFVVAAAPNLRHAVRDFEEWNGRFYSVSISNPEWMQAEELRWGSRGRVLSNQFRLGTVGLLSSPPVIDIYTGHPVLGPALLPALGIAGLGWLLGQKRFYEVAVLGLIVGGNLAGVILTLSTPQPQRASSLVAILAVLGGVAVGSLLGLLHVRDSRGIPWRTAAGALFVGGWLGIAASGFPLDSQGYAEAGGPGAGLVRSASGLLGAPRYDGETIYLHAAPFMFSDFPSFRYLLPGKQFVDLDSCLRGEATLPAGFHLFSWHYLDLARECGSRFDVRHGIHLPDPARVTRDLGYVFRIPVSTGSNRIQGRSIPQSPE